MKYRVAVMVLTVLLGIWLIFAMNGFRLQYSLAHPDHVVTISRATDSSGFGITYGRGRIELLRWTREMGEFNGRNLCGISYAGMIGLILLVCGILVIITSMRKRKRLSSAFPISLNRACIKK